MGAAIALHQRAFFRRQRERARGGVRGRVRGRVGGGGGVGSTIESLEGREGSLNEISDVGPIRAGGRKRTPNVRLQDQG